MKTIHLPALPNSYRGVPKVVRRCSFPITSTRRVDLIVTELAVMEPTEGGLILRETAPGATVDMLVGATQAHLTIPAGFSATASQSSQRAG